MEVTLHIAISAVSLADKGVCSSDTEFQQLGTSRSTALLSSDCLPLGKRVGNNCTADNWFELRVISAAEI